MGKFVVSTIIMCFIRLATDLLFDWYLLIQQLCHLVGNYQHINVFG